VKREAYPQVSMLEKILVNWAILPDAIYYTLRSKLTEDKYYTQSFSERCSGMWEGRILRYKKLLAIKQENGGEIPARIRDKIKYKYRKSPCAYTRLLMSYLR
jgi:hypothetical protein